MNDTGDEPNRCFFQILRMCPQYLRVVLGPSPLSLPAVFLPWRSKGNLYPLSSRTNPGFQLRNIGRNLSQEIFWKMKTKRMDPFLRLHLKLLRFSSLSADPVFFPYPLLHPVTSLKQKLFSPGILRA